MDINETVIGKMLNGKFDMTNIPKGIYFAVVKENGNIKTVKSFYKR